MVPSDDDMMEAAVYIDSRPGLRAHRLAGDMGWTEDRARAAVDGLVRMGLVQTVDGGLYSRELG